MMNNLLQQFKLDPIQMISRKFNIPQNMNDPQAIIQHLLNTGQVTQAQVNNAMQMRNNPIFNNLIR